MKKGIAAVMAALLLALAGVAAAEGKLVRFEDGFEFTLPSDWVEIKPTEELLAGGIAYIAASPDDANTMQISWLALEEEITIGQAQESFAEFYPDARVVDINGIQFVEFTDAENDVLGFTAMDAEGPGMYNFTFTPASDESLADTAAQMMASVRNSAQ